MSDTKVFVSSMNCQGLADAKKRRDVFHYLRSKAFSVYLLQDTHFNAKLENYIRAEWGYECYFASYSSNSRGVAILFNNNFEFEVRKVYKDSGGNYILLILKMLGKEFLICNIYGPNKDDPDFYVNLNEKIKQFAPDNIIMGGDWNLVLDFDLDYYNYKHNNNAKAQEKVEQIMIDLDLTDIWRDLNPELKRFTWRRNNPIQQSRLDFFLISDVLSAEVLDVDIHPGYRTDHSLISISLGQTQQEKRFSLWKFNASLLKDKNYIDEVNEVIRVVKSEYAAFPYNRESIEAIANLDLQLIISDQLFLDTLLMKIRDKTISYATMKKRKSAEFEKSLELIILRLERKSTLDDSEKEEIQKARADLITLREKKMEGVLLRSRARWIVDGEKVTKYFCALEKRNYVNKQILKLNKQDGSVCTDTKEIRKEVTNFYENLYLNRVVEDWKMEELVEHIPKLNDLEKQSLEGQITLEEAGLALKNMKNSKSPGSDGFSAEFFKMFWSKVGGLVIRSLNEGFIRGELSSTQKEGVIVCIPKADRPRDNIKNWRPISLLNVVYKIGSACLANRLKNVLPSIIHEDQTGFIKNRYLGDNVRLVYDLIDYLNVTNQPGLLLCLDFEKAFDSVSWSYMFKVLEAFGCGPGFCRWIGTFYADIKSSVLVNGSLGSWFHVQRGCRQGDPISPYLFIMCVEILGIMIRENKNIRGIRVKESENKIAQYADDTELMLEGDQKSFEEAISNIENFGKVSGLLLNTDKSSAIWLGSKKYSDVKFMPHLRMEWNPERFKILGIWFSVDLTQCVKINFHNKFMEIKRLYTIWSKRQITPLGRVAVLKSLILSKLVHLWLLLPNPPDVTVNNIQKSVFQFIWGNKNDRISRKISTKSILNGGIGIPDVTKFMYSLKLSWLRKLKVSNHKWTQILKATLITGEYFDKLGTSLEGKINDFWVDVLKAYKRLGDKITIDKNEEIGAEPVFCNNDILVGGKIVCYQKWVEEGVYKISHFLNENGNFLEFQAFKNKYGIQTNFITYNGIVKAIKKYIRILGVKVEGEHLCDYNTSKVLRLIFSVNKGARPFYDILVCDESQPNCCRNWENRLEVKVSWNNIFRKIQRIKDAKLKWFQIRIIHRILGTNITLQSMGIENSYNCTFCHMEKENIQHLFWSCQVVQRFWMDFQAQILAKCPHAVMLRFTQHLVIFGCDHQIKTDDVFDLFVILAKMYIYQCKMVKELPIYDVFVIWLKKRYEIEKFISCMQMRHEAFCQAWSLYQQLFS